MSPLVRPYLRSAPAFRLRSLVKRGSLRRSADTDESAYGFTSSGGPAAGASSPRRSVEYAIANAPRAPKDAGTGDKNDVSVFRGTIRRRFMPQTCCFPVGYRSDLNGIMISVVQPCSSRAERTSHTP